MYLISHRGGYHEVGEEENSIEAIKKTVKIKEINGVEIDIRMTKDRVLILHHNANIRYKNKNYLIANENYMELDELYYQKEKKHLATLNDVLKILPKNKYLLIEIKKSNSNEVILQLNQLIKKYKTKQIIVISFFIKYLNLLRIMNQKVQLGILINRVSYLLDFKYLYHVYISKNINIVSFDKNMVTYNKAKNILKQSKNLNIFTINSLDEFHKVKSKLKDLFIKYRDHIYITTTVAQKIIEEENNEEKENK